MSMIQALGNVSKVRGALIFVEDPEAAADVLATEEEAPAEDAEAEPAAEADAPAAAEGDEPAASDEKKS